MERESDGGDPCGDDVQILEDLDLIDPGNFRLRSTGDTDTQRAANLSFFSDATLSFDYRRVNLLTASNALIVEISGDGGSNWSEVDRITGPGTDADYESKHYDVSPFSGADTVLRLVAANLSPLQYVYLDNIQIEDAPPPPPPPCANAFRDEFNARTYSGSDGALAWATDWLEINEADGPTARDEQVFDSGEFDGWVQVQDNDGGGEGIEREADLSAFTSATLSFHYRRDGLNDASDYVTVEVSDDGDEDFTELDRIEGPTNDAAPQSASYDISAYISEDTRIRFLSSATLGNNNRVYFDNVEICVDN